MSASRVVGNVASGVLSVGVIAWAAPPLRASVHENGARPSGSVALRCAVTGPDLLQPFEPLAAPGVIVNCGPCGLTVIDWLICAGPPLAAMKLVAVLMLLTNVAGSVTFIW